MQALVDFGIYEVGALGLMEARWVDDRWWLLVLSDQVEIDEPADGEFFALEEADNGDWAALLYVARGRCRQHAVVRLPAEPMPVAQSRAALRQEDEQFLDVMGPLAWEWTEPDNE